MKKSTKSVLAAILGITIMLSSCNDPTNLSSDLDELKDPIVVNYSNSSSSNSNGKIVANTRNGWINRSSSGNLDIWAVAGHPNYNLPPYPLWVYYLIPAVTNPIRSGFNYSNYFNADWDGDGDTDLITRDAAGTLRYFQMNPYVESLGGGAVVGNRFNFTTYLVGDFNGDGTADLICGDASGVLRFYPFRYNTFIGQGGGTIVGHGFVFTHFFVADWNGDGMADLICRASNGALQFYPFRNNTFYGQGGGTNVGNGFNFSNYFVGEWTGDNIPDLVGRTSSGDLKLYPFGSNTFIGQGGGAVIATNFNYINYFPGDWSKVGNKSGLSDIMCLDASGKVSWFQYNLSSRNFSLYGTWNMGIYANYFPGKY